MQGFVCTMSIIICHLCHRPLSGQIRYHAGKPIGPDCLAKLTGPAPKRTMPASAIRKLLAQKTPPKAGEDDGQGGLF